MYAKSFPLVPGKRSHDPPRDSLRHDNCNTVLPTTNFPSFGIRTRCMRKYRLSGSNRETREPEEPGKIVRRSLDSSKTYVVTALNGVKDLFKIFNELPSSSRFPSDFFHAGRHNHARSVSCGQVSAGINVRRGKTRGIEARNGATVVPGDRFIRCRKLDFSWTQRVPNVVPNSFSSSLFLLPLCSFLSFFFLEGGPLFFLPRRHIGARVPV